MDEIVKNLQLITICNKEEEINLYNESVKFLKDRDLNPTNTHKILDKLRKLKLQVNDQNKIKESEIRRNIKNLFQIKNLDSYEYEQTMEILFESIDLVDKNKQLDKSVYDMLLSNLKKYFHSSEYKNVSFSSLHLLLYYFYRKKYKNNRHDFEKKYNIENFLDGSSMFEIEQLLQESVNEAKVVEHLRLFLNDNDRVYKTKTHKLCHHLNITLSLSKMLEFAFFNHPYESISNLVMFIGSTGVGKSTVLNYLNGTEYELLDDETTFAPKDGSYNKLKCAPPNSLSSETLYSEILKFVDKDKTEIYYADLPGFFDKNVSDRKSVIAALGLPILIQKSKNIKAIVIVLDYKIFIPNSGDKGRDLEKISKNLLQLFKDFEENKRHINILFAITKPPPNTRRTKFNTSKILENIDKSLKGFIEEKNSEDYQKNLLDHKNNKDDCENKLEVYMKLISILNETLNNENSKNESNKYKNRLKKIKSVIWDENFSLKFGELVNEFNLAIGNKHVVELTIAKWTQIHKELENKREESRKFIKEYYAEILMFNLIADAIRNKNIFVFKCFKEENDETEDDKLKIIKKIKSLSTNDMNKSQFFNFESNQEFFKVVSNWCVNVAENAYNEYSLLSKIFKKIVEKDRIIDQMQQIILANQRDLDFYLKPVKPLKLVVQDFVAKSEHKKQMELSSDLIESYRDLIKAEEDTIRKIEEKIEVANHDSHKFNRKSFFNRNWNYKYPSAIRRFTNKLFNSSTDDIKIEIAILTCWDINQTTCLATYTFDKTTETNFNISIPNIGSFQILKNDFDNGQFQFRFNALKDFIGFIKVDVFIKALHLNQYIDQKEKCKKSIEELENLIKKENPILKYSADQYKIEEDRITFKLETIKDKKSNKILEIVKKPLYDLCYVNEKFVDYLLRRENMKTDSKTLQAIFEKVELNNLSTNPRNREQLKQLGLLHYESDKALMNRLGCLYDHEVETFIRVSAEIGFSLPNFVSLLLYLNEITKKTNIILNKEDGLERPFQLKLDSIIKRRETNFQAFNKRKETVNKMQALLNTYDKVIKILDFKDNRSDYIEELDKFRKFVNRKDILAKPFFMKQLSEITLENYTVKEDVPNEVLDSKKELNNNVQKPQNEITYNFEFENLREENLISDSKKKLITIKKLEATEDKVLEFYLPQLLSSASSEYRIYKDNDVHKEVLNLILKRAESSIEIALKLFLLINLEIGCINNFRVNRGKLDDYMISQLDSYNYILTILIEKINSIKDYRDQLNHQKHFIECIQDYSKYNEAMKKKLLKTKAFEFFDSNYKFNSFKSQNNEKHKNTNRKPIEYVLSVTSKQTKNNEDYIILYKKDEDLRKDFFVIQSLELIQKIFVKENVQNVLFFSYKVFPIASSEGLIKVVQANTVSKILNDHKSVLNYLNTLAQNAEDIKKYKDNYFKSCAGYLLTCYLFGLGDRHYDNIMITNEGIIFNIDYGFIMNDEPKQIGGFRLAPEIKWTSEIVEPILSNVDATNLSSPFEDEAYKKLMNACCSGFHVLRKHSKLLTNIFEFVISSKIPSINTKSIKLFNNRFLLEIEDTKEVDKMLIDKINQNFNTWGGWVIDKYHEGIFRKLIN